MVRNGLKRQATNLTSVLLLCFCASLTHAESTDGPRGGDDTILVEFYGKGSPIQKTSRTAMVKRLASSLIGIDLESSTSFGQNKKSSIIKSFKDIAERSQYRVDVDNNEIGFRFTLNL